MTNRAQRRARVRRGVAAGAAAVFLASFGAVATWGRQPAQRAVPATAPAPAAPTYDPYGYDMQQQQSAPQNDPAVPQDTGPAPMTTRQS